MNKNFNTPKYEEYFIYSTDFLSLTTIPTDFSVNTFMTSPDTPSKIYATTFLATDSRLSVRFKDYDSGRYFQDTDSDIRNVAGRPLPPSVGSTTMSPNNGEFLPYIWSTPYFIYPTATFTVEMANTSAIANQCRMSFHGAKIQQGTPPWLKDYKQKVPYMNTVRFDNLAANATTSSAITTGKDGDFLITSISLTRTGQGTIFITESTRGRDWMDKAVHLDNFAGQAYSPNNLLIKSPRFLEGGGALNITVTNLEAAATNSVRVTFMGYKLLNRGYV